MDTRDKAVSLLGYLLLVAMAVAVIAGSDGELLRNPVTWLLILIVAPTST